VLRINNEESIHLEEKCMQIEATAGSTGCKGRPRWRSRFGVEEKKC